MPTSKSATSYRLSVEARAVVDRWSKEWGLSAAAIVDLALRQFGRWAEAAPPPGEVLADLRKAVADLGEGAALAPDQTKRPGRPRQDRGGAGAASNEGATATDAKPGGKRKGA